MLRPATHAGTWYPGTRGALEREVDAYVDAARDAPPGAVTALIAPHAGIMFSGPVAAYAYKAAARERFDVAVLAGPSHFAAFDGLALYPEGAFDSPLGPASVDSSLAARLAGARGIHVMPAPHVREHSLEMQLPFLRRLLPDARIVPILMGFQTRDTIADLADALASSVTGRCLLVASTDLSHFFDAGTAARLDSRVRERVAAFDAEGLLELCGQYPEQERGRYVGCGAGPMIAVMLAARALGARDARVLQYAHSGEISGDHECVVGYLAAIMGNFQ